MNLEQRVGELEKAQNEPKSKVTLVHPENPNFKFEIG